MQMRKYAKAPHDNKHGRNDEINEEICLWRNAKNRHEKEKKRSEQDIYQLCGDNRRREFSSKKPCVFAVEPGDEKHRTPNNKENRKWYKV
jgi:hypothetical protein